MGPSPMLVSAQASLLSRHLRALLWIIFLVQAGAFRQLLSGLSGDGSKVAFFKSTCLVTSAPRVRRSMAVRHRAATSATFSLGVVLRAHYPIILPGPPPARTKQQWELVFLLRNY